MYISINTFENFLKWFGYITVIAFGNEKLLKLFSCPSNNGAFYLFTYGNWISKNKNVYSLSDVGII